MRPVTEAQLNTLMRDSPADSPARGRGFPKRRAGSQPLGRSSSVPRKDYRPPEEEKSEDVVDESHAASQSPDGPEGRQGYCELEDNKPNDISEPQPKSHAPDDLVGSKSSRRSRESYSELDDDKSKDDIAGPKTEGSSPDRSARRRRKSRSSKSKGQPLDNSRRRTSYRAPEDEKAPEPQDTKYRDRIMDRQHYLRVMNPMAKLFPEKHFPREPPKLETSDKLSQRTLEPDESQSFESLILSKFSELNKSIETKFDALSERLDTMEQTIKNYNVGLERFETRYGFLETTQRNGINGFKTSLTEMKAMLIEERQARQNYDYDGEKPRDIEKRVLGHRNLDE